VPADRRLPLLYDRQNCTRNSLAFTTAYVQSAHRVKALLRESEEEQARQTCTNGFMQRSDGMTADKNLTNVVKDLEKNGETRHDAQQLNQDRNDRRKESTHGPEGYQENEHSYQ
jgi:hypothetical protein